MVRCAYCGGATLTNSAPPHVVGCPATPAAYRLGAGPLAALMRPRQQRQQQQQQAPQIVYVQTSPATVPGAPTAYAQPAPVVYAQPQQPQQPPRGAAFANLLTTAIRTFGPMARGGGGGGDDVDDLGGSPMSVLYPQPYLGALPPGTVVIDGRTGQPVTAAALSGYDDGLSGFDDYDDDDDDDDDAIGAMTDADVSMALGDDQLGAVADDKIQRQLDKVDGKIQKLRNKSANLRQPFLLQKRANIQKKISKLQSKRTQLQGKLRQLRGSQAAVDREARAVGRAGGRNAAYGALVAAGLGGPPVQGTRGFYNDRESRDVDPRQLAMIRAQQAASGVRFDVSAPPGSGRKVLVPFYQSGLINPRNALTVPVAGITATTSVTTGTIPYATVKIVGFYVDLTGTDLTNGAIGLVNNLQVQGGSSLFLSSNWQSASLFSDLDNLQGLRDYPRLQTTNFASLQIAATGDNGDVVVMQPVLVVDVLSDDTYGVGVPMPTSG